MNVFERKEKRELRGRGALVSFESQRHCAVSGQTGERPRIMSIILRETSEHKQANFESEPLSFELHHTFATLWTNLSPAYNLLALHHRTTTMENTTTVQDVSSESHRRGKRALVGKAKPSPKYGPGANDTPAQGIKNLLSIGEGGSVSKRKPALPSRVEPKPKLVKGMHWAHQCH